MASPSAPHFEPSSTRIGKKRKPKAPQDRVRSLQPEKVVGALQAAQDNLLDQIYELEEATPAHQTLRDIIIKDILIVASIAFWPAMLYWLV